MTSINFAPFDFAPPACSVDAPKAPAGKEASEEPFHRVLVVLVWRHKSYISRVSRQHFVGVDLKCPNFGTKEQRKIEENNMVGLVT